MNWFRVLETIVSIAKVVAEKAKKLLGRSPDVGRTPDGDKKTLADEVAYRTIVDHFSLGNCPYKVALFSEETGKFEALASNPELLVVCDELDGSRPHAAGMSCCSVSIACFPAGEEPVLKNVRCGVIYGVDDRWITFVRGEAGGIWKNGEAWTPSVQDVDVAKARVFFETVNSACLPLLGLWLAPFEQCTRNGMLSIASSAWTACAIASGAAHVHLHLGRRICDRWPELSGYILSNHQHQLLGNHCYDVAAAWGLIQGIDGCVISDGYGNPLDNLRIDDVSDENTFSQLIAPTNLHGRVLQILDEREKWLLANKAIVLELITAQDNSAFTG